MAKGYQNENPSLFLGRAFSAKASIFLVPKALRATLR
jgi:hypothetical protein